MTTKTIQNLQEFIAEIFKETNNDDTELFYRGHSSTEYKLLPSIFRPENHIDLENQMFEEMCSTLPNEFLQDFSSIEKLVRMQHYGLPTRLLDLTSNPLMGLFFACSENFELEGAVYVFSIRKQSIKFSNSDSISCLANLSRLRSEEKSRIFDPLFQMINTNLGGASELALKRLYHFIKQEKPYFKEEIKIDELLKILCFKPKMSNQRVIAQSGAFLIFGQTEEFEKTPDIKISKIIITKESKQEILTQLDKLNINHSTVYPDISNTSLYVKRKYQDLKANLSSTQS